MPQVNPKRPHLEIKKGRIQSVDYQLLRKSTGWEMQNLAMVDKALDSDLFSVTVFSDQKPIGMGRIIGDGVHYFYIQDVVVLPPFKSMGIGSRIMDILEEYLDNNAPSKAFIGLMSADGVKNFYKKLGYQERPSSAPGMFKIKS